MANYPDPIGKGGAWINEFKSGKGKFMAGEMTFQYNGHSVTVKFVAFKNEKKEGKQPDYNLIVNDAFPAKEKKIEQPPPQKDEEDIPF